MRGNRNTILSELNHRKAQILFAATALLTVYMGFSFLPSIIMGGVFAAVAEPLYMKLLGRGFSPLKSTLFIAFAGTLVLLIPLGLFILVGIKAATNQIPAMLNYIGSHDDGSGWTSLPIIGRAQEFLDQYMTLDAHQFRDTLRTSVSNLGGTFAGYFATLASRIPGVSIQILFAILSFIFFLLSAEQLRLLLLRHSPFSATKTQLLIAHFRNICSALVISTLVVGFLQGVLFTLGCAIARMPNLPLIGLGTFLMSFVPAVGSGPVYIFMIFYSFMTGEWWQVIVIAFFAAIVAISDNTVRPLLLRTGARMHPIIALTSVLAGIEAFGFAGIFLGPILMTMLFQIYSATYESTLDLATTEAAPNPEIGAAVARNAESGESPS